MKSKCNLSTRHSENDSLINVFKILVHRLECNKFNFFWNIDKKSWSMSHREDICLQTLFLLFKCANHRNKRSFVLTANDALVGTLSLFN